MEVAAQAVVLHLDRYIQSVTGSGRGEDAMPGLPEGQPMKKALLTSLLTMLGVAAAAAPAKSKQERSIDALIAKMTLEEKLGQLYQLGGPVDTLIDPAVRGLLGSTLNIGGGAPAVNKLQRAVMERSRLKIPVIVGADVIHGYRTVFPIPLGMASAWDPAAVETASSVAAAEAAAAGIRWTFAPMVDIARDPRWGRIAEGSGEDPYLGSAIARAAVRGFQGKDYGAPDKVAACAKHWAAYGAAEAGRDYNTTDVSERTLREIYFPPFKAAVDAGVATFMSSFNDLNGVPATANPWLQTKVLRREWGFDGFVVSDYTAVQELLQHGIAADGAEAARRALQAGVDMEMVSTLYSSNAAALLKQGWLSMAIIDEAVRRVLRIKHRAGLFERPYVDESLAAKVTLTPENRQAARRVAGRSMVLLKNDGAVLPLSKSLATVAVIGPLADAKADMLGTWCGEGKKEDVVTLLEGVRAKLPQAKVVHVEACRIASCGEAGIAQANVNPAQACRAEPCANAGIQEAVKAARKADAVILALGESSDMSGEANSRADIGLPGGQLELAKAVLALGRPTAVVLFNGRPLTISDLVEISPAILEAWHPGIEAGNAVADVLFGDVNPGGKLPVSFPRVLGQVPIYYNYKNTGRPFDPADHYRSKYMDAPNSPLFPFGYGRSYTQFKLSGLSLSAKSIRPKGRLTASVDVENIGAREGDEVVQLYIRDLAASATRPVRELKGFERVTLKPGEKRRVSFELTPELLGAYDQGMKFQVEPGKFKVFAGDSSVGGLEDEFEVVAAE